jgi:hypothetical protein
MKRELTESEIQAQKIRAIRQRIIGLAIMKCLKNSDENVHLKYEKKDEQL